ncbi:MAG: hypothetical protein WCL21_18395 [Mariniphaga sp.]
MAQKLRRKQDQSIWQVEFSEGKQVLRVFLQDYGTKTGIEFRLSSR